MMNHSICVIRRARPLAARTAPAIMAAAGLALLAAACSASRSSTGSSAGSGGSSNAGESQTQLLAFAHCMRSEGVPSFPDPSSASKFPGARQLGVSGSEYQAAINACQHLLPNGGSAPDQAELQQEENAELPFSQCMRSHGISDWPDPSIYTNSQGETAVVFKLLGTSLDGSFDSPQVQAASSACQHLLPPSIGSAYRIVR